MRQLFIDLWETEVESPFPGLTTHAYLYTSQTGNVLFYNTGHLADIEKMADLGGVAWQLLSHRDELGESILLFRERYGTKLGGHIREKAEFAKIRRPDKLFSEPERILDNIDVIPTPGHTPGSCCFWVKSPHGKRYLFTGDTLYLSDTGWKPGLLPFSDPDDLAASLRRLQKLEPNLVCSSAFSGQSGFEDVTGCWADKVDQALWQLSEQVSHV